MNIACPICKSEKSIKFYTVISDGQTYSVETCLNCSHLYSKFNFEVNPDNFYNDEVYQLIDNRRSVYSKILDYEYGKVVKQIRKLYPNKARILDFGSGKGIFLNLAQEVGFEVMGIETSHPRANFAEEKYGLKIIREMYYGGSVDKSSFDVITLFHVLEHLDNPKELLKDLIRDNMEQNGLVILEVPNLSSLQSGIAKNQWMHLDIPRHLSHFSKKRLREFCEELDLEIVRSEYFSWHVGVMGMCQSILSLFGYKGKIIRDLKLYDKGLMLAMPFVFPIVVVMELVASAFSRGGVIRVYCRRTR